MQTLPGLTPIHHAIRNGDRFFVEKLICHGARLDLANRAGQTALHLVFAVDGKLHPEFHAMTQLLLDYGAFRDLNV